MKVFTSYHKNKIKSNNWRERSYLVEDVVNLINKYSLTDTLNEETAWTLAEEILELLVIKDR